MPIRRAAGALATPIALVTATAVGLAMILVASFVLPPVAGAAGAAGAPTSRAPEQSARACNTPFHRFGAPRPLPHASRQEAVVRRLLAHPRHARFTVERAQATHLGVIALLDGDLRAARRALAGVSFMGAWNRGALAQYPPRGRMASARARLLDPLADVVGERLGGRVNSPQPKPSGFAGFGTWQADDAVVVEWRAPVPRRIRRLARLHFAGAEVRVYARPFSISDVQARRDALAHYLNRRHVRFVVVNACADERGLVLGVPQRRGSFPFSSARLSRIEGMSVHICYRVPANDLLLEAC